MKRTLSLAALAALVAGPSVAQVSMQTARNLFPGGADVAEPLPDLDSRFTDDFPSDAVQGVARSWRGGAVGAARLRAVRELAQRVPGLAVDWDPVFGTPRFVRSTAAFLTAPSPVDAVTVVERFVADQQALFEISPGEVELARRSRDYLTQHNGVRHLTFQQQVDGADLFGAELRANVTAAGELINVSSTMLPRPEDGFDPAPIALRPLEAIRRAAEHIGTTLTVDPRPAGPTGPEGRALGWSQTPDFRTDQPVTTELVYFPRTRRAIVPAWLVQLPEVGIGNTYMVIVDGTDGTILWRYNQLDFLGGSEDVTLRVYPSDSPTPGSPGLATPSGSQPFEVARSLLTLTPGDVAAESPDHWIDDGVNETRGNNVEAHTDLDANNSPDLPRPQGAPYRVFDFPLATTMEPSTYRDAAVVNLFYHCNVYHDRLYALGFDEAAGNFQVDNFGRGGAGGDPVQADAQDGSGVNNANFGTPFDGSDGRMQMFTWSGSTPDRDGDLDAEIIYHEYSHGLSNRLVGVGTLGGEQSGGMGEGWGDYFGIALLAAPSDDFDGNFPFVGYSTRDWNGQAENYYFGIRRFPYSTNLATSPATYADIDPAQNSYPPGIPQSTATSNTPDAIHKVGEVWCNALLECRTRLIGSLGFSGNELMMQLVVDGMKLSPVGPNFIEERDAILQADLVNNGGANLGDLWGGFAKRGLGAGASSPPGGSTTTGVVEDFAVPPLIYFSYPGGVPDQLLPDQVTAFAVDVDAFDGKSVVPGSGLLYLSIGGGAFSATPLAESSPGRYTATIPPQPCFGQVEFYVSVDTSLGLLTDPPGGAAEPYFSEAYGSTDVELEDDFEADTGWTVTNSAGLTDGEWERGVPVDFGRGDPPADSDGSGQCYLTRNDPLDANSDVDAGWTTLTSPVYDLAEGGLIRFDYWLNDTPSGPIGLEDGLQVEVATNSAGTNWQLVRDYQDAEPGWRQDSIRVGVEVPASSTVRVRFTATEVATPSDPGDVLEAGIDAISVETLVCEGGSASFCDGSDGSLAACPCGPGTSDSGCDVAQATGGVRLEVVAQDVVPQNRATLRGSGFPAASSPPAVVIRAGALDANAPVVFGDGLRCVGTPIVRLGAAFGASGTSLHTLGHGSAAGPGAFYYQIWFRNTPQSYCDPTAAFNLSSGGTLSW